MSNKERPIDRKRSEQWAIMDEVSMGGGVGPASASYSRFELVNVRSGRAHSLYMAIGGAGASPLEAAKKLKLPISFSKSIGKSYSYFTTTRPVNFRDFDEKTVSFRNGSVVLYSYSVMEIFDSAVFPPTTDTRKLAKFDMDGWCIATPGVDVGIGKFSVQFGDGSPSGTPKLIRDVRYNIPNLTPDLISVKQVAQDDTLIIVPSDVLFGFDEYTLALRVEPFLDYIAEQIAAKPDHRILVQGHTDSIGTNNYNLDLSRKRAQTVANWIVKKMGISKWTMVTVQAFGERRPKFPNKNRDGSDNPTGRAKNRRVEILLYRK
jgi:outer membrane protein OmpA-like peptidoglycan-associated protein